MYECYINVTDVYMYECCINVTDLYMYECCINVTDVYMYECYISVTDVCMYECCIHVTDVYSMSATSTLQMCTYMYTVLDNGDKFIQISAHTLSSIIGLGGGGGGGSTISAQSPGLCPQNKIHSSPLTTPIFAKNPFQPLCTTLFRIHVVGGCGQTNLVSRRGGGS